MTTSFSRKQGIGGLKIAVNNFRGTALESHVKPVVRDELIEGRGVCLLPTTPVTGSEYIEFHAPPDPECSYILNRTRLSGSFTVKTSDGRFPQENEGVMLNQHYGASLFAQMEIYLNGTQINDLSFHSALPYKHYFDNVISKSRSVLKKIGQAEGYSLPHLGPCYFTAHNGMIATACDDSRVRHHLIVGEHKIFFNLALCADLFNTDKYLPPNIDIKIKLKKFKNHIAISKSWHLEKDYSIYIEDVKLFMHKILPSLSVRESYKARLLRSPSTIRYKDSQLKVYQVPLNVTSFMINNINKDVLPTQIIFCFQHNELFNQSAGHNGYLAYNFDNLNIISFNLKRNGQNVLPKPISCDFTKKSTGLIELYNHFAVNVNKLHAPDVEKFASNDTFFAFDLTPDNCNSYHTHPTATGDLEVEVHMTEPVDDSYYMMSYAFYESGITIDKNLQVSKIPY